MVLKRPYGLMIKHFKLIHLLLLILSGFVIWQLRPLVSFFNDFIRNGYTATILNNMAGNYINVLIYFALIFIFALLIMLIILLRFKKKPHTIYTIALIYYIILFVGIIIASGLLNGLEETLWSTTAARLYRDIATMITVPQYIFIPFWLIRSLGFNIKQFNFKSDLEELDLAQSDSEEIELNIGFETYKAERLFNRTVREFKYYFYENKFIMITILAVTIVILLYLLISNYEVYDVKYKVNQNFTFSNLNVKVEDTIITNLNYAGEKINDNYYLLLKVNITNNTNIDTALEYNKFLVYSKNNHYVPATNKSSEFIDYGEPYYGEKLKKEESKTIVLPYEIKKSEINNSFYLSIYTGLSTKKDEYHLKTIRINLSPILVDNSIIVGNSALNNKVSFNSSYLNNSSLTITDYQISSNYVYEYENCVKDNCNTFKNIITPNYNYSSSQTLLILGYSFELDKTCPYARINKSIGGFASDFIKVRYNINNEVKLADINNLTPENLKDKLVVQTNAEIANASKVDLIITIRNKTYIINLVNK